MAETQREDIVRMDEEYDAILPEGYGEGDDIFDSESWSGAAQEDAPAEQAEPEKDETTAAVEETTDAPSTTGEEVKSSPKLKFKATVDHKDTDVELDEADLPSLYQKAQVVERVQNKLSKMTPDYEQAVRAAKILGYDSVSEMLKAATDAYKDAEVSKLVRDGTSKTIAEDYIARKMDDAGKASAAEGESQATGERDWKEEARELLVDYPHLQGKPFPHEVTQAAIKSGKSLKEEYRLYAEKQSRTEAEELRKKNSAISKENKILKQNAEAAKRAPVTGVAKGGAVERLSELEESFLKGFNADY